VVLALSNSGETDELLTILPVLKRQGVPLIAMTGNPNRSLARLADVHLDVSVPEEACPLGLAPTSSTTAALVMGDALAIALLEARGFTSDDFAARIRPAARPPPAAAHQRHHARRRRFRASTSRQRHRCAGGDDAQGPRHDRDRRWPTGCSACSPTATCAARWTMPKSTCAAPGDCAR
jgi:hypothetical protein